MEIFNRSISAFSEKTARVDLYASVCYPEPEADDYALGWWNAEKAERRAENKEYDSIMAFSDRTSAFYAGGRYGLVCGGFKIDDDDLSAGEESVEPEDLGEFLSAKIKFSFALSDIAVESSSFAGDMPWEEPDIVPEMASGTAADMATGTDEGTTTDEFFEIDGGQDIVPGDAENEIDPGGETESTTDDDTVSDIEPRIEIIEPLADGEVSVEVGEIADGADNGGDISVIEEHDGSEDAGTETADEQPDGNEDNTGADIGTDGQNAPEDVPADDSGQMIGLSDHLKSLFYPRSVRAQNGDPDSAKIIIWYTTEAGSAANMEATTTPAEPPLWRQLDTITADNLSNAINGGYFAYEASFLRAWDDARNLKIKFEGVIDGRSAFVAYLDSVWVEAEYKESELARQMAIKKQKREALKMLSDKLTFRADEDGEFRFSYTRQDKSLLDGFSEFLGLSGFWENVRITAKLVDPRGQVIDISSVMIFEEDGEFTVKLPVRENGFRPGKYILKLVIEENGGEATEIGQDFSWGVLAVNVNKSIYTLTDDSAYLQMAVLDDYGHTVCDADLTLEVISPEGDFTYLSTAGGSIVRNERCGPDNIIDTPDYFGYYMLYGPGVYRLRLAATTANGTWEIGDRFEVRESVPFDIERVGPTRINPVAEYGMTINIKVNEDYEGNLVEVTPGDFQIINPKFEILNSKQIQNSLQFGGQAKFKIQNSDAGQSLIWEDVELKAGDEMKLSYTFDAPDISPEFYLLGPLSLTNNSSFVRQPADRNSSFSEARRWQIASDLPVVATSTNGTSAGWTNATSTWDNGIDTYATRLIPKKTGDGEPANYLQSTANTAVNLGGDITQVRIGVEGRVQNTAVRAYLQPYFNGTTPGTAQMVDGSLIGTTDDNQFDYVDITSQLSGYPGTAWTWADIINLDIRLYGGNNSNSTDYTFYVDQLAVEVQYTPNNTPTSTIESAVQRIDTSGTVDVTIAVWDSNLDYCRARLKYEAGIGCVFAPGDNATIDPDDASATSTYEDVMIDNSAAFHIGTSTGRIKTASGTNYVYFDWLSASDLDGQEGTYCLQLTANDYEDNQVTPATTTIVIDNKAPSAPGALSEWGTTTKDTVILTFGATSTDLSFAEYKIFYSTSTPITEADYVLSSSTDENLGDKLFLGAATTSVSGLLEDTTYYFAIWAYDDFGHKSSSSAVSITTNKTPLGAFNPGDIGQKTDGSGIVDISFDAYDKNAHISVAKIEYEAGSDCVFSPGGAPALDTAVSATYGVPSIDNGQEFQIRNITTSATNTLSFDWLSASDLDDEEGTYCLRLTVNDGRNNQNFPATTTFTLDNADPEAPGGLGQGETSTSSIRLIFGATSTETNFKEYRIYYKEGTSGVTEDHTQFSSSTVPGDPNLGQKDLNGATSTVIGGLDPDTWYVFNIWAYDTYGNKASATEIAFKTNASVNNVSLAFINPVSGNIAVGNGTDEANFRAVVSEENGWNLLDTVKLRLADRSDHASPFTDLEFTWSQSSDSFSETGADVLGAAALSENSTSTCAGTSCTLDFRIIFNNNFATSSVNYAAELLSANDGASVDETSYPDFYQVKIITVKQIHYRWRNDNGGE